MNFACRLRFLTLPAFVLCGIAATGRAQMILPPLASSTAQPAYTGELPQFDVISVKPHKPGDGMMRMQWGESNYKAENLTLKNLIADVYDMKAWLVFGLPPWAESSHWDIDAKVSDPDMKVMKQLSPGQRRTMIGGILKDRFGLVIHREEKAQPVFLMTVLPEGSKLKQSPPLPPAADGEPAKNSGGSWASSDGSLKATRMKLTSLAEMLSYQVERTVIDKTGLADQYDLELKWTTQDRANAGDNGTGGDAPPEIFEALKEQLGLKLTPAKEPVPTVVVDKIEQPEAN